MNTTIVNTENLKQVTQIITELSNSPMINWLEGTVNNQTLVEQGYRVEYPIGKEKWTYEQYKATRDMAFHRWLKSYAKYNESKKDIVIVPQIGLSNQTFLELYPYRKIFDKHGNTYCHFILTNVITPKPWDYIFREELERLNPNNPDLLACIRDGVEYTSFGRDGVLYYFSSSFDSLGITRKLNYYDVLIMFRGFKVKMMMETLLRLIDSRVRRITKTSRRLYAEKLVNALISAIENLTMAITVLTVRKASIRAASVNIKTVTVLLNFLHDIRQGISSGQYHHLQNLIANIEVGLRIYTKEAFMSKADIQSKVLHNQKLHDEKLQPTNHLDPSQIEKDLERIALGDLDIDEETKKEMIDDMRIKICNDAIDRHNMKYPHIPIKKEEPRPR